MMDENKLEEILAYIDENVYEKISLGDLAERAGYSPFYFSKLFSEIMGIPITGYIRIRKLQYALGSLLEGKKVLDVSLMYGFDSHEGFTRSFTQLFGSTPSKVRKYLSSYNVPNYGVPNLEARRINMESDKKTLSENMHQIIFEVLKESLNEAKEGFCSEINITVFKDGIVQITDNGRGIPLSKNIKVDQRILDKILSGHPISAIEYAQMGDFSQKGMQIVNSLCENLQVNVFRNGTWFRQDYVRGIAQHDVIYKDSEHSPGMEIILKPDTAIFGDTLFSIEMIKNWVDKNVDADKKMIVNIHESTLRVQV